MSLLTTHLSGIKIRALMVIVFAGTLLNSCKKETFTVPINTATIRFDATSYTIERDSPEALTIVLPLSLPLEEDATAVVSIDEGSTADESEYTIDPLIPSDGITLNLPKGATEVAFKIASLDNFEGDKTVIFQLSSATGGLTVANTNAATTVTIKGKPIILPQIVSSVTSLPEFGNVINGTPSASQLYTISGIKLTSDVNLAASENFQVSLDNVTFNSSVSIGFAAANAGPVNVYARFLPNSGENQSLSGTISHSSGTVPGVIVNVSGNEYGNALPGVLLMSDNFDYGAAAGNLTSVSSGNWKVFSGTVNPVQYFTPGLSFTGYAGSGVGGAVTSVNGGGSRQDLYRDFPEQSSGGLYTSMLVNFNSAANGDFFTSWRNSSGAYFNRIYAKDEGGKLYLGVGKSSATVAYSETAYNFGQTYLLVTKYDFSTGVSSIYILENGLTAIEPPAAGTTQAGTAPASLTDVIIRQGAGTLTVTIDGVRVATSWKDVVGK